MSVFVTDGGTTTATASTAVTCTKCRQNFATRAALHAHIVDCGDYWRSLSNRITWVFVLRGSELPAQQSSLSSSTTTNVATRKGRRCGKFRWGSSASHESVRRQMQRMLIKQHVGSSAASDSRRASVRISSQRGIDSPPLTEAPTGGVSAPRDSRKPLPTPPSPALRRHIRRRAAASGQTTTDNSASGEVADLKCEKCEVAYNSTAERDAHTAGCRDQVRSSEAGVERNADTKDNNDDDDDDDIDPTKHMCIYCSRQFMFLRALRRHVADGCSVRRDLVERQEYVDDEWEAELKAAAGVGRSSTGGSTDVADDLVGDAADGARRSGGKRRRRCKNWSSSKSKSRKSARSSGDDADDSLFGWEDAYLSTWGKDEREDITQRDEQTAAAAENDAADVKSTTALAQLLTNDILINVSDRETRTSSDDLDALVQQSSSSVTNTCLSTTSPVSSNIAVTTTTTTTLSSGMSFAVKLELLTGSQDNDVKPTSSQDVDEHSHQVGDVVLVVDEILKSDDVDIGTVGLDSSGTSSSCVSDTGPAVELARASAAEVNNDAPNDDTEMSVPGDISGTSHVADDNEGATTATENSDVDVTCRLKARRRRGRRLTMTKRKKS